MCQYITRTMASRKLKSTGDLVGLAELHSDFYSPGKVAEVGQRTMKKFIPTAASTPVGKSKRSKKSLAACDKDTVKKPLGDVNGRRGFSSAGRKNILCNSKQFFCDLDIASSEDEDNFYDTGYIKCTAKKRCRVSSGPSTNLPKRKSECKISPVEDMTNNAYRVSLEPRPSVGLSTGSSDCKMSILEGRSNFLNSRQVFEELDIISSDNDESFYNTGFSRYIARKRSVAPSVPSAKLSQRKSSCKLSTIEDVNTVTRKRVSRMSYLSEPIIAPTQSRHSTQASVKLPSRKSRREINTIEGLVYDKNAAPSQHRKTRGTVEENGALWEQEINPLELDTSKMITAKVVSGELPRDEESPKLRKSSRIPKPNKGYSDFICDYVQNYRFPSTTDSVPLRGFLKKVRRPSSKSSKRFSKYKHFSVTGRESVVPCAEVKKKKAVQCTYYVSNNEGASAFSNVTSAPAAKLYQTKRVTPVTKRTTQTRSSTPAIVPNPCPLCKCSCRNYL